MSISVSISIFFVIAALYIVIVDLFTMFFVVTGMPEEKARFQVISLLTNSGYSTRESEIVVEMLARRKMARTIMLFGYIFSITIVSIFVNMLVTLSSYQQEEIWPLLLAVAVAFTAFILIKRLPAVRSFFNNALERLGRKWIYGKKDNAIVLLDEYNRGVLAKILMTKVPEAFRDKSLKEIGMVENYHVHVSFVTRGSDAITHVNGNMKILPNDILFVFGQRKMIEKAFAHVSSEHGKK